MQKKFLFNYGGISGMIEKTYIKLSGDELEPLIEHDDYYTEYLTYLSIRKKELH